MHNKKIILYSISIILMIDYMNYGLLLSIAPQLFLDNKYGLILTETSNFQRELLFSISWAIFSFMSIVGMSILCSLSDQYGRKKIFLLAITGFILNYFVGAAAVFFHSFILFLANRIAEGFLDGVYPLAETIVGDMSQDEQERIDNFKVLAVFSTVGMIIGPLLSIVINNIHQINPLMMVFLCSAMIATAGLCFSLYGLKNMTSPHIFRTEKNIFLSQFNIFKGLYYILSRIHIKFISIAYFLFQFGSGLILQTLGLYLSLKHGYTSLQISEFMLVMYLITIIGMNLLPKIFSYFLGYRSQLLILLLFVTLLLFGESCINRFAPNGFLIQHRPVFVIWVIAGIFYAIQPLINLIFNSFLSNSTSYPRRGMVLGGFGQIFSIAWALSALLVGILIEYKLVLISASVIFGCSTLLMLCHFQLHSRNRFKFLRIFKFRN